MLALGFDYFTPDLFQQFGGFLRFNFDSVQPPRSSELQPYDARQPLHPAFRRALRDLQELFGISNLGWHKLLSFVAALEERGHIKLGSDRVAA